MIGEQSVTRNKIGWQYRVRSHHRCSQCKRILIVDVYVSEITWEEHREVAQEYIDRMRGDKLDEIQSQHPCGVAIA